MNVLAILRGQFGGKGERYGSQQERKRTLIRRVAELQDGTLQLLLSRRPDARIEYPRHWNA